MIMIDFFCHRYTKVRDKAMKRNKLTFFSKCDPVDESIETTDEHLNDIELLSDITLITLLFETS